MSIREILESWGTAAEIIKKFEDEDYDMESLALICDSDLAAIIPLGGPRTKFKKYLEEYRKSMIVNNNITVPSAAEEYVTVLDLPVINVHPEKTSPDLTNAESILPSTSASGFQESGGNNQLKRTAQPVENPQVKKQKKDYDLISVLRASPQGQLVLAESADRKKNGLSALTEYLRDKVAEVIINHELTENITKRIPSERYKFLFKSIIEVFPSEIEMIWLGSKNSKSSTRGKLQSRYYNLRRKLIKCKLISKNPAPANEEESDESVNDDSNVADEIEWLKGNSKPWTRVQEKWELTSKRRLHEWRRGNLTIHEYMNQYPALKDSNGYLLLVTDFEQLYPNSSMKLYSEFSVLSEFILNKIDSKDKALVEKSSTPDGRKVRLFHALNNMFTVVTAVKKKKEQWRPSRRECKEALLRVVKTNTDILPELELQRSKYETYGLTSAPQAVIVGADEDAITNSYVNINQIMYEVQSPIAAIDVTFKAIHALDSEYPKECEREWMFLQIAVYGITTPHDRKILNGKTSSLIDEYKIFKNQKEIKAH